MIGLLLIREPVHLAQSRRTNSQAGPNNKQVRELWPGFLDSAKRFHIPDERNFKQN